MRNISIEYERTSGSFGPGHVWTHPGRIDNTRGLYIASDRRWPIGARMVLRVVLANGYRFIACALVVKSGKRGFEVEFLGLNAVEVAELEKFVGIENPAPCPM